MNKQTNSDKQNISIMVLFLIGSSSIFVMGIEAERDLWIAIILATIMALVMALFYARLHFIFPDKDLYDIIEICFGNFIGKLFIILFTLFMLYWSSDVLVNYCNFIHLTSLENTPQIIPMSILGFLCALGIREGICVLGRWSQFFIITPIIILIITIILLIPEMNFNNIRPVLYSGIIPVFKGTFNAFSFPFGQIVAFTMTFSSFENKKSPYKIYIVSLLISGLYLLILSLTNIFVLGIDFIEILNFPSYGAISRINLGDVLQSRGSYIHSIYFRGVY